MTDVFTGEDYLLKSQVTPSNSSAQLNENESLPVSEHVAPFLHGLELHGPGTEK